MSKRRRLLPLGRGIRRFSPRNGLVRSIHWLRLGVEAALGILAIAAIGAVAWAPTLPVAPAASAAVVPARPAFDLAAARSAVMAQERALAALLGPAVAGRAHEIASVRRGDTLADVLERADIAAADFNTALIALRDVYDPRTLQVGQDIELFLDHTGESRAELIGLTFTPDVERRIEVARLADGGYRARETLLPLTRRIARAQGSIDESLYADAIDAGASDLVVNEIARLLAHTVDFQREIHPGDTFDIVFEQYLDSDGEVVKTGEIYYIGFTPKGRELAYWRYTPPESDPQSSNAEVGYYDAIGESARRFLMKTPVNATRISSGFSRSRRHPVLGYTRAHKGTDFAAPRGTPIYAAGNGVVERANEYGSFGNYVRIRHANGYQTIYGHLNGFARGIRAGTRVSQGDVIGYVGMTGTATGPHLHYEVHLNEVAMDPMSLDVPTGRTLLEAELPAFEVERALIDAMRSRAVAADSGPELFAAAPEAELVAIAAP